MRLVNTGGAGFIGSNLARRCIPHVEELTVLDDLSTGFIENIVGLDVRMVEASVLDEESVAKVLRGADAVVHLAALGSVPRSIRNPTATHLVNATGTLTVLEQARRADVGHVVVASSSSVYGSNPALPKRESDWVGPMSPYAVSKLATEQYALAYRHAYGMDTLAFRFFNVYGPGQRAGHAYAAVIPAFIDALLTKRPLVVNGTGEHSRDFTFVGSVCDVLWDSLARRVTHPGPVNLAFGTRVSLNDLIRVLADVAGREPAVHNGPPRLGDVWHSSADTGLLRSLFHDIEPTTLRVGLTRTIDWFRMAGVRETSAGRLIAR